MDSAIFKVIQQKALVQTFSRLIKFNYTAVGVEYAETGYPDKNGSYNGIIGLVQRGEVDMVYMLNRMDSLPFEPARFTPPLFPADVTILSRRNESKPVQHELTHFLAIDRLLYFYSLFSLFFVLGLLYVFIEKSFAKKKLFNPQYFLGEYLKWVTRTFELLLDQEQFDPRTIAGMVLAYTACLFAFFAVFSILMSTVGADLVVHSSPPYINSLDDLLARNITPVILKKLYLLNILKASPPGDKLHKLYQRILKRPEQSIFDIEINNAVGELPRVNQVIQDIVDSKMALLLPSFSIDMLKTIGCFFLNQLVSQIYDADQLFAPGVMVGMYSHKINKYCEKVLNYIITTGAETGLILGSIQNAKPILPYLLFGKDTSQRYNSRIIQCIKGTNKDMNPNSRPFSLKDMSSLFVGYLVIVSFAIFTFLVSTAYDSWYYPKSRKVTYSNCRRPRPRHSWRTLHK